MAQSAVDHAAVRLQLKELQATWHGLQDSKFAIQVFLMQDDETLPLELDSMDLFDKSEEQALQEEIAALSSFINVTEDQQVAMDTVQQEEAQQAASLQLATALDAEEQWEATVLRPHDAALARAIAGCSDREWEARGYQLQDPLDMSGRPAAMVDSGSGPGCMPTANSMLRRCSTGGSSSNSQQTHLHFSDDCDCGDVCTSTPHAGCGICFESFPSEAMWSALLPAAMASSSQAAGRCPHKFCSGCMKQYVAVEVQARRFPIYCPDPSCDEEVASDDVLHLLADRPQLVQLYQALEAEQLIDKAHRVYCPFKDCSVVLERSEQEGQDKTGVGQQAPFECPSCHRSFCLSCGITGWHTGMSCQDFQALPPELKSAEDANVLHYAELKRWKRCPAPGCGHMVERTEGCNHMRCRCGCEFCYACGMQYKDARPADNVRSTPNCNCDLFEVPDAGRPQPWRNGRLVSRTRCRHSSSIHDCPNGPQRCWFWHDEDDEEDA